MTLVSSSNTTNNIVESTSNTTNNITCIYEQHYQHCAFYVCCAKGTGEVLNQTPGSSLAPLTIRNVEREQPQPWRPRFVAS